MENTFVIEKHPREAGIIKKLIIPEVYDYITEKDAFVAGGAVRAVFTSDHINDIDIFFRSPFDFHKEEELNDGIPIEKDDNYRIMFNPTDVAWTHKPCFPGYEKYPLQQMICAVFGSPVEIIKKFDFTMCMAAWIPNTDEFIMDKYFLKHCAQKRLHFNINADYPICSMWRANKFIKRGWKMPALECIKIALKINNIDIKDKKELKRQLMGIDTLFLKELTDALESKKEEIYDYTEAITFLENMLENEEE